MLTTDTYCSLCATLTLIFSLIWATKKLVTNREVHVKLPPGPRGVPLLGYLPFLSRNLHQMFMEMARIYGPIFKLSIGQRQYVIINSPSLAKEVVRDHDTIFANRNPTRAALAFSYGGNDIAFSPHGPKWRFLRKIFVLHMLGNENLDATYELRKNVMRSKLDEVYGKSSSETETVIDVGELAFVTVIDMISSMFWGGTVEEGDKGVCFDEFPAAAAKLIDVLGKPNVSDFFPVLAKFDLLGVEREMKNACRKIDALFDLVIGKARKAPNLSGRKDFLQILINHKDEETGKSISKAEVKAMFMDIIVGGTDTTSTTVLWAMAELMMHPEAMKKVQEELAQIVGLNAVVEEFHLNKLLYLRAVVKEVLRLHPVAPLLLPRSPSRSSIVGGYNIPEGTKVFLNVWAMHRDPQFWDNPSDFCPERFLSGKRLDFSGNCFEYLPFGSGRRICAGLALGERMMMYVLASLLHSFEWKFPEGTEPDTREKFGVVLEKEKPLLAVPRPKISYIKY